MSPYVQQLGDLEFPGIFVLCNAKCADVEYIAFVKRN